MNPDAETTPPEKNGQAPRVAESSADAEALHEVVKRQRAEEALRESEQRYRLVVEASNDYIFDWDFVGARVLRTEVGLRLFGYPPGEIADNPTWGQDRIHPEDRTRVMTGLAEAKDNASADSWRDEFRFRCADGTYAPVLVRGHFVRDPAGNAVRVIGSMTDLTETKRIREALRTTERRYHQLVQSLPAAIYTCDSEGRIQLYNEAAAALWGQSPEIGKVRWSGALRLFRPNGEALPASESAMAISLREARAVSGEEMIIERPDGTRRHVLNHPEPQFDAAGHVTGAVNMLVDITDRKLAEIAQARLAAIVESSDDAIVSKTLDGQIVSWNAGAERVFGYTAAEAVGNSITMLIPQERLAEETGILSRLRRGERVEHFETVRVRKDGRQIDVSLTSSPVRDASGQIIGASKIARDITEQKQSQRALIDSEERFRAVMNNAPVAMFIKDLEGRYTLVNPLAAEALGHPEGVRGLTDHDLLSKAAADHIRAVDLDVISSGTAKEDEVRIERPGYTRDFLSVKFPLRNADGEIMGVGGVAVDLTERKRAQLALDESDQRLRLATQTGKLGVWDWDIVNDRISWSESLYAIHGVSPQWFSETVGDFSELVHPDDRELVARSIQDAMHAEEPYELEFRAVRPDGETIWLFTNAVVLRHNAQPTRMLGATMDITERKKSEIALRDSEERFRTLSSHAPVGIFRAEPNGDNVFVNESWCEMAGMTAEQSRGSGWLAAVHPDDRERVAAGWRAAIAVGAPSADEFRFQRTDGAIVWLQGNAAPLRDFNGELTGYIGTVADITEHKRSEDALRNSERMYRAIGESIDYGVWVCDAAGRNVYCSDSFLQLVGLTQEECSNEGWASVLHPDDAEQTSVAWEQCVRAGLPWDAEHRFRGVDGQWHPVLARGVPVRDDRGKVTAWVGINLDISELKQAENKLRESEARFRSMADTAPVLIWTNGVGGNQYVNREYQRFTGRRPDELLGAHWVDVLHPDDQAAYLASYQAAFDRKAPFDAQVRMRRADGEYRWLSCTAAPRLRADGAFLGHVGCSVDVTDIKASEAALREADRRKDDFLAMLGHELRNPLAGIVTGAQVLSMLDLTGEASEMQQVIARQASHMSQIVDDLLDVSRIARGKLTLRQQHVNLSQLLRNAVEDYRRSNDLTAEQLRFSVPLADVWAWCDPTRVTQALTNVVHNSFKFSAGIMQTTVTMTLDATQRVATLAVVDRGIGMTRDTLSRIFEPFNQADTSLGRSRGGLGLGLALAKGLIELHGGAVTADSAGLSRGSTLTLALPCEAQAPGLDAESERPATRSVRVLIIDDRRDAILPLSRMLEMEGHQVATAMDGPAGLAKALEFRPEVILCDIGLPGEMSGYDVSRSLRTMPEIAETYLVAVTGYGQEDDRRHAREAGFDYHVTKPLERSQVAELMGRMPRF